ncbi:MAG: nicotinate-nucleotide adenylyltransferase [Prevotellaceae bacterium]|jgi:nicotinate-nucleotide adenylyltransferase|nr:nicotinate-nucleotide adenylyltransferase [Prevotellaceae bacterium]
MKKTGLLFGSFNPIHMGHLMIAHYIRAFHALEEIWFVVTPQNPTKPLLSLIPGGHRLAMAQLAVAPHPPFRVCDIEFYLPQPAYTIDTLDALRTRYRRRSFVLLIGSDNWLQLPQWKDASRLCARYPIIVYPRFGFALPRRPAPHPHIVFAAAPRLEISSTFIRQALAAGRDVSYFLPPPVADYIEKHNLYTAF